MATHQKKAFITYGALIDFLCPVGKDLILAYDLGDSYASILAAMFPGTTWSNKTTVNNIGGSIAHDDSSIGLRLVGKNHPDSTIALNKQTIETKNIIGISNAGDLDVGEVLNYKFGLKITGGKTLYSYTRSA